MLKTNEGLRVAALLALINGFGLFTVGVFYLGSWYGEVNTQISQIPVLVEEDKKIPAIVVRLDNVEARLDRLESRLDRIEDKLDRVIERLNTLPNTYQNTIYTPQPQY